MITEVELQLINEAFKNYDAKKVCFRLFQVCKRIGMEEVAQRAGINRQALYTILKNNQNPALSTLENIMSAVGIAPLWGLKPVTPLANEVIDRLFDKGESVYSVQKDLKERRKKGIKK